MPLLVVDLNEWHAPDLRVAAREGIGAAIVKVTECTDFVNPNWPTQRDQAREAGLPLSGYHRVCVGWHRLQAEHLARTIRDLSIPVMLDTETTSKGGVEYPTEHDAYGVQRAYETLGGRIWGHYLPMWYWSGQLNRRDLSFLGRPLIASHYVPGTGPPADLYSLVPESWWAGYGGLDVTLLQFTSRAQVAGDQVDCSAYRGDQDAFRRLIHGGSAMLFVTRSQWGARPPAGTGNTIHSVGVKVHYLGSAYISRSHDLCAAVVRDIQRQHMDDKGWRDIAYTRLVCEHGYVFEGRGLSVQSAANGTTMLNDRHHAVCALLGAPVRATRATDISQVPVIDIHGVADLTVVELHEFAADSGVLVEPTSQMLHGLRDAIDECFTAAFGREILGHRDGYPTECPGGPLYSWVQAGAPRPVTTTQQEGDVTPEEINQIAEKVSEKLYAWGRDDNGWGGFLRGLRDEGVSGAGDLGRQDALNYAESIAHRVMLGRVRLVADPDFTALYLVNDEGAWHIPNFAVFASLRDLGLINADRIDILPAEEIQALIAYRQGIPESGYYEPPPAAEGVSWVQELRDSLVEEVPDAGATP